MSAKQPEPSPDHRLAALRAWLAQVLEGRDFDLAPASSDASFRRYFRVRSAKGRAIVMDAPPDLNDSRPFVALASRLAAAGLTTPAVRAADLDAGFLLLGDLGDTTYLRAVTRRPGDAAALYDDALRALARMQARVASGDLPAYDVAFFDREVGLLETWLLERHLGHSLGTRDRATLERVFDTLREVWEAQPRVFVHRDYHSRNLMRLAAGNPGILDFQDAVEGPLLYDLASLARDVYLTWDEARIEAWVGDWRTRAAEAGVEGVPGGSACRRWLDFTAAQRLVKILGLFCRLHHRDGKARYLADLPRTLAHLRACCDPHPELRPLPALLDALGVEDRLRERSP